MATTIEYALMAGASYIDTRPLVNQFPIPTGWAKITNPDSHFSDPATGFEAISFKNTLTNEIVISYAGTNPNSLLDPDNAANIGLANGLGSAQLLQAAEYYLQVKAANTINGIAPNITLTGHSLGGGLAALVGVFFGVQATTFDQAPFAKSATLNLLTPDVAANLKIDLAAKLDTSGNRLYSDTDLTGLTSFLQLRQANGGIPNSNLISTIRVDGELTSSIPVGIYNPIGTPATVLQHGPDSSLTVEIDMHSQSLLTAFLQSTQAVSSSANPTQTFSEATKKLTDLLKMIFDKNLFAHDTDPNTTEENFLEHFVRHQTGGIGGVPTGGDAMVTRFTTDLWKIAQDNGLTLTDKNLSKALMAFAMQMYYEDTTNAKDKTKQLYTGVPGGIQFDMADVSQTFATAVTKNEKFTLNEAKGYASFKTFLDQYYTTSAPGPTGGDPIITNSPDKALILSMLPYLRDWYVQAGTPGLTVADTQNRGAFMLGGSGIDLVVGNAANDSDWRVVA